MEQYKRVKTFYDKNCKENEEKGEWSTTFEIKYVS